MPSRLRNERRPRPARPGAAARGGRGRPSLVQAGSPGAHAVSGVADPADPALSPALAAGGLLRTRIVRLASGQGSADSTGGQASASSWRVAVTSLRPHWPAGLLLAIGLALRVITQLAYHPAILYIDSLKYLYDGWRGSDPVGYKVPLRAILTVGDLGTVVAVQHLLGLAMAVALYVLLTRRGVNRWLATLAMAPILLDAYQLQAEEMIMPDVVFQALIVLALVLLLWQRMPSWLAVVATGLILGYAVTVREVGMILIVPAVLYLLIARGPLFSRAGWWDAIRKSAALGAAFAVPILLYCSWSYYSLGHFELSVKGSAAGRMAEAADCATLKLPAQLRPICPTAAEQKQGPDWLADSRTSPLVLISPVKSVRDQLLAAFSKDVEHQQPLRVVGAIFGDSTKLFEVNRTSVGGATPIFRWQFQLKYQNYVPGIVVHPGGDIILGVQVYHGGPYHYQLLLPAYGGKAQISKPLASFLRSYQLHGGYTPGPLLLLFTLAGLAGSLLALFRRKASDRGRQLALGSLLFFVSAAGLLLVADFYLFSWRYQLPALITLPPAGVLGIAAALDQFRRPKTAVVTGPTPRALTAGASAGPGAEEPVQA